MTTYSILSEVDIKVKWKISLYSMKFHIFSSEQLEKFYISWEG